MEISYDKSDKKLIENTLLQERFAPIVPFLLEEAATRVLDLSVENSA